MSAGIASCCTPCAAAPIVPQQPATTGGGAPMKGVDGGGDTAPGTEVAPDPIADPAAPAPGAQPAAPSDATGGGATSYDAAPEPVQCGQWVPAPVVVGGEEPPAGPPEPIDAPDASGDATGPDAPAATTPASQLPTWPEWQQHFQALGLRPEEIAKIGSANLTDAQLAEVYEDIHTGIVERGGIPGQSAPTQTTWSPAWEQRFLALGLPREFVAELKAQAERTGAGDAQIEQVYRTIAEQLAPSAPGQQVPGGQQVPQQDGPGWNPQVEQAFRSLGMPDEVIQVYAQSGAPLSGLEAAYKHAVGRVQDFTDRGWMEKFTEAKMPPVEMWALILGDKPASDEDLHAALEAHNKGQRTIWQKGGQLATSLFPGGRLAQYLFGKEFVSGDKIDRTSPMEIGMAALSGLALFAAFRGVKSISAGWAARNGNFSALNNVNNTLTKLGLPATGTASMSDAAMGATATWGTKQKLISLIPGTQLHKQVVGLGHAEAAARAFNAGGAASLMKDADGALQVATLAQVFDDIKTGAIRMQGGANAYFPQLGKKAPMLLDNTGQLIKVSKSLGIGNGNSQLVSLMEVGGTKLGQDPNWLRNAVSLGKEVTEIGQAHRDSLGRVMAGNAARNLETFTKDGFRPMRYINGLRTDRQPDWYARLAAETAKQFNPGAPMLSDELLEVMSMNRLWSGIADEGAAAFAKIDRSAVSKELSGLLDEATSAMDDLKAALSRAQAGGKVDDAAQAAHGRLMEVLNRIGAEDAGLLRESFPTLLDDGAFAMAKIDAVDAARAAWTAKAGQAAAGAAGAADDVAAAAASHADEVADAAQAAASRAGSASTGSAAPAAVADAAEGAAFRQPAAAPAGDSVIGANWKPEHAVRKFTGSPSEYAEVARTTPATNGIPSATRAAAPAPAATAAPAPASAPAGGLQVNARGEAVTPSGLIVPSYASPASGFVPADVDAAAIQRFQSMMDQLRRGVA